MVLDPPGSRATHSKVATLNLLQAPSERYHPVIGPTPCCSSAMNGRGPRMRVARRRRSPVLREGAETEPTYSLFRGVRGRATWVKGRKKSERLTDIGAMTAASASTVTPDSPRSSLPMYVR